LSALVVPTFNGQAIFGAACKLRAGIIAPVAMQINAYAGQNGLEVLFQGKRGGTAQAEGRHGASTALGLNAIQANFRSYNNAFAYLLVDHFGNGWPFTKLQSFELVDRVIYDAYTGWYWQAYRATFIHLLV
jgi:hypothetical protein